MEIKQLVGMIMVEVGKEITEIFERVGKERPGGVELERDAREIGRRCGRRILEKVIGQYGNGNQGKKLPCKCAEGYG